jgi:hypothetical protein
MRKDRAMTTGTRDINFAEHINEVANAIEWPQAAFTVTPWEAVAGVVVAIYEAFATPDRALLQHALNGIAF